MDPSKQLGGQVAYAFNDSIKAVVRNLYDVNKKKFELSHTVIG